MNTSVKRVTILSVIAIVAMSLSSDKISPVKNIFANLILKEGSDESDTKLEKLILENQLLYNELERQNERLEVSEETISANIIYRPIEAWNQFCWIDRGFNDSPVIEKNSPVVIGNALVGIVDEVLSHRSRIRLLTDKHVNPSVRCMRGEKQKLELHRQVKDLTEKLSITMGVFTSTEEKEQLLKQLESIAKNLENSELDLYLAKGIMQGTAGHRWRSAQPLLFGTFFNYDYPDDRGHSKDLRTGRSKLEPFTEAPMPLIRVGDLLVTNGLDGLFPSGLHVGTVSHIRPLKEGDFYFSLEAVPSAPNIDHLSVVYILPPQRM